MKKQRAKCKFQECLDFNLGNGYCKKHKYLFDKQESEWFSKFFDNLDLEIKHKLNDYLVQNDKNILFTQRSRLIKEMRNKFVQLAIEGKYIRDELKGATLYAKMLDYLDEKLKEKV